MKVHTFMCGDYLECNFESEIITIIRTKYFMSKFVISYIRPLIPSSKSTRLSEILEVRVCVRGHTEERARTITEI